MSIVQVFTYNERTIKKAAVDNKEIDRYVKNLPGFIYLDVEEKKIAGFYPQANVYKYADMYFTYWIYGAIGEELRIQIYRGNSVRLIQISFEDFFKHLSPEAKKHTLYYMHLFV